MRRKFLPLLLVLLAVPGCFPVELDVSKDGKILIPRQEGFFTFDPATSKTQKICGNEEGQPVFARYSPNGKEFLAVTKSTRDIQFHLHLVPLNGGGKGKEIFKGEDCGYTRFSPDGNYVVVTKASQKEHPVMKDRVPELHLIDLKGGASKLLVANVAFLFRWSPDSKSLVGFQIEEKDKSNNYHGNLISVDVASGKATPLLAGIINQQFWLDLAPDGKKALFTAMGTNKVGQKVELENKFGAAMKLNEFDLAAKSNKNLNREARYAIYSPSGKKVLLGSPPEGFSFNVLKLEMVNADMTDSKVLAPDASNPMGEGMTIPGWVDDKSAFYFVERTVYGTTGKSLNLMLTGTEGGKRRCVQPLIDLEIYKE